MKSWLFQHRHRTECVVFWTAHPLAIAGLATMWSGAWLAASIAWTYVLVAIGQEAGSHRYFSHRAFHASPPVVAFMAFLASIPLFGGPVNWALSHVMHHRHADTELDPTSSRHMSALWIYSNLWKWNHAPIDFRNRAVVKGWWRDTRDPVVGFFYRYYFQVALVWWAAWLLVSPQAFLYVVLIPSLLTQYAMNSVSVLGHARRGARPHETKDDSRNSRILNGLCPGLGYHNNHHADPGAAKCGPLDLPWLFIRAFGRPKRMATAGAR
jgi:stearoyl-CoA desaturase (delta-9 desaturase)